MLWFFAMLFCGPAILGGYLGDIVGHGKSSVIVGGVLGYLASLLAWTVLRLARTGRHGNDDPRTWPGRRNRKRNYVMLTQTANLIRASDFSAQDRLLRWHRSPRTRCLELQSAGRQTGVIRDSAADLSAAPCLVGCLGVAGVIGSGLAWSHVYGSVALALAGSAIIAFTGAMMLLYPRWARDPLSGWLTPRAIWWFFGPFFVFFNPVFFLATAATYAQGQSGWTAVPLMAMAAAEIAVPFWIKTTAAKWKRTE